MPSETSSFPRKRESRISNFQLTFEYCRYPKVWIPATFRHSRESGNLEPLNFQLTFEYCRYPKVWIPATFRHSRESGNLEPLNFQLTFEYCRYPKVWIPACAGMTVGDDAV